MSEKCPLVGMKWSADIPELCFERCEGRWEDAISKDKTYGDYDTFPYNGSCLVHEYGYLEGDDMSLQTLATGSSVRIVGVLDTCGSCGEEYGAQSFVFNCPEE